jgi:hypothetical protein
MMMAATTETDYITPKRSADHHWRRKMQWRGGPLLSSPREAGVGSPDLDQATVQGMPFQLFLCGARARLSSAGEK